ncbi:MAG: hypothetical protein AAGJ40_05245 [Planctomycetota bacterium]
MNRAKQPAAWLTAVGIVTLLSASPPVAQTVRPPVMGESIGLRSVREAFKPADIIGLHDIGLRLPYAPTAAMRRDASLHAVTADRQGQQWVAVGDHGVVLRSDDAGITWTSVDTPVHCTLHDVIWLAGDRIVAVGGGFEPVTGVSRGVSIISDDLGITWKATDALQVPRMTHLHAEADGTLIATGDRAEASGRTRFVSLDHGQSWMDDETPNLNAAHPRTPRQTMVNGSMADVAMFDAAIHQTAYRGSVGVAVGDFGRIERWDHRTRPNQSTTVRHPSKRLAVLMVPSSAGGIPWGLLGREVFESGNRVGLVTPSMSKRDTARLASAATSLGLTVIPSSPRHALPQILDAYRPSVIAFDSSVDLTQRPTNDFGRRPYLRRVVMTHTGDPGNIENSGSRSSPARLHPDALLPHAPAAITVGDIDVDAGMMLGDLRRVPSTIEVTDITDRIQSMSGKPSVMRGIALTSGLAIPIECQCALASVAPASRHRLQMATARRMQTKRVWEILGSDSETSATWSATLDDFLLTTAADARARSLWLLWLQSCEQPPSPHRRRLQRVLLEKLERYSGHDAIGRWADIVTVSRRGSREYESVTHANWHSKAEASQPGFRVPSHDHDLSPFQVRPVGFLAAPQPQPSILVPSRDSMSRLEPREPGPVRDNWEYMSTVLAARRIAGTEPTTPAHRLRFVSASTRPRLDGSIDEPFWRGLAAHTSGSSELKFAVDNRYLFISVRCREPVPWIKLCLDVDGDLLSSYHWIVEGNGDAQTTIDGTLPWSPAGHVATDARRKDSTLQTAEWAVERSDLAFDGLLSMSVKTPENQNAFLIDNHPWLRVTLDDAMRQHRWHPN